MSLGLTTSNRILFVIFPEDYGSVHARNNSPARSTPVSREGEEEMDVKTRAALTLCDDGAVALVGTMDEIGQAYEDERAWHGMRDAHGTGHPSRFDPPTLPQR